MFIRNKQGFIDVNLVLIQYKHIFLPTLNLDSDRKFIDIKIYQHSQPFHFEFDETHETLLHLS